MRKEFVKFEFFGFLRSKRSNLEVWKKWGVDVESLCISEGTNSMELFLSDVEMSHEKQQNTLCVCMWVCTLFALDHTHCL